MRPRSGMQRRDIVRVLMCAFTVASPQVGPRLHVSAHPRSHCGRGAGVRAERRQAFSRCSLTGFQTRFFTNPHSIPDGRARVWLDVAECNGGQTLAFIFDVTRTDEISHAIFEAIPLSHDSWVSAAYKWVKLAEFSRIETCKTGKRGPSLRLRFPPLARSRTRGSLATSSTRAPRSTNARAIALPIPRLAPVTIRTCWLTDASIWQSWVDP